MKVEYKQMVSKYHQ